MVRTVAEVPVSFMCQGVDLIGMLHIPEALPHIGVVIVVGGPQYRVGSHRQFVLLARSLASQGAAVLRFDCRGMGDSAGSFPGFEYIAPDVAAAVDFMERRLPSTRRMILWGLCDAASAICERARRDPRVSGVAIVNPWVRTEAGHARAKLKHYYLNRLMQGAFFRKVFRGEFKLIQSIREFFGNVARSVQTNSYEGDDRSVGSLADSMAENLRFYRGHILLIMSGRDLTAREFDAAARGSKTWRALLRDRRLTRHDLADSDHTFSRREWTDQVSAWTWDWIKALEYSSPSSVRDGTG